VATAGVAEEDRPLVADQFAAAAGETCTVLLAAAGGESPHTAAVWSHAVQDRGPILSDGVGEPPTGSDLRDGRCRGRKNVGGIGRKRGRFAL